jgi:hypothetical protein
VIQFSRGDEGDLVIDQLANDPIRAHVVAMVECDAHDLMWRLRGSVRPALSPTPA